MDYRKAFLPFFTLLFVLSFTGSAFAQGKFAPPLFVFNNGVKDAEYDTPAKQVALVKAMGFAGMEKNGLDQFDETLAELDRHKLELFTIYVNVNLDAGAAAYDQRLPDVLRKLKGRRTMLWLNITSRQKTFASSDRAGDAAAIPQLREIADMAAAQGLRIMVYPHYRFWLERVDHAIELVEKVARRNVGLTFNLPHWLALTKPNEEQTLPALLKRAKPHLFAVSLNGATNIETKAGAAMWDSLIQPLGAGAFDVAGLLRMLKDIGFRGPVGLQCYNLKQPKPIHLKDSVTAWQAMLKAINR
jgi:sugar phosphate isomerase/epimerase